MSIKLVVQNISKTKSVPSKKQFKAWIEKALAPRKKKYEIIIRIVGIKEITKLNKQYRKKNKPTNILSFNFYPPVNIETNLIGDLVICAPIVKLEAKLQHKTILSHWAHLTVHGVLHLLGYDHQNDGAALKMERLETKILKNSFQN
ncbi:MAG: rRNA maturation RNase YbeY [bacterium]